MDYHFTVLFEKEDEGGYHAFCPALKGCNTQGETLTEAMENINEAVELYVESLLEHGEPVPQAI